MTGDNKPKKTIGRPKKEKHGKHIWVPEPLVPVVLALKEAAKKERKQ